MQAPSSHGNRHPHDFIRKCLTDSSDPENPAIRKRKINGLVGQRSSVGGNSGVWGISRGEIEEIGPALSS